MFGVLCSIHQRYALVLINQLPECGQILCGVVGLEFFQVTVAKFRPEVDSSAYARMSRVSKSLRSSGKSK